MKRFLIILLVLINSSVFGQRKEDVIYLKDNSVYRGEIVENRINEFIKLKTHDDNVIVLKYDFIASLKKENYVSSAGRIKSVFFAEPDSTKIKLINPEVGFNYLSFIDNFDQMAGMSASSSLMLNLSDRFSFGLAANYMSLAGLSDEIFSSSNSYFYNSILHFNQPKQENELSKKTMNNSYLNLGIKAKVYLVITKRTKHYLVMNFFRSIYIKSKNDIVLNSTISDIYDYSYGSTRVIYPLKTQMNYTIKYEKFGNTISGGYGIEFSSKYKLIPYVEFMRVNMKTAYQITCESNAYWVGIIPPAPYDNMLGKKTSTLERKVSLNSYNFTIGFKF